MSRKQQRKPFIETVLSASRVVSRLAESLSMCRLTEPYTWENAAVADNMERIVRSLVEIREGLKRVEVNIRTLERRAKK